jgi:hypothetical protein
MWQVLRHGGRGSDEWRSVHKAAEPEKAQARFAKLKANLRQGGLALLDPSGAQVAYTWAPRLRTRW